MEVVDTAQINTFGITSPKADVQPSEPIFVLTSSQLQEIISQGVHEATRLLNSRVDALQVMIDLQNEKTRALESRQDLFDENLFIQLRLINKLRHIPQEGDEVPVLDELYKEMKAIGRKQTDFATAARMVRRSKSRMLQLKAAIALDQRFILIPSESHSQKLLIRLREFYKPI